MFIQAPLPLLGQIEWIYFLGKILDFMLPV